MEKTLNTLLNHLDFLYSMDPDANRTKIKTLERKIDNLANRMREAKAR